MTSLVENISTKGLLKMYHKHIESMGYVFLELYLGDIDKFEEYKMKNDELMTNMEQKYSLLVEGINRRDFSIAISDLKLLFEGLNNLSAGLINKKNAPLNNEHQQSELYITYELYCKFKEKISCIGWLVLNKLKGDSNPLNNHYVSIQQLADTIQYNYNSTFSTDFDIASFSDSDKSNDLLQLLKKTHKLADVVYKLSNT